MNNRNLLFHSRTLLYSAYFWRMDTILLPLQRARAAKPCGPSAAKSSDRARSRVSDMLPTCARKMRQRPSVAVMLGYNIINDTAQYAPEHMGNELTCATCHLEGAMLRSISWVPPQHPGFFCQPCNQH